MKKIITICTALTMTLSVFLPQQTIAQSPEKMSYQAVVRDGNNNLVSSTSVGIQISILQGSANGNSVYVETQNPTSNTNGLVSLEIGDGTVVSGDFASIDWENGPYFLKTETDPTGGSNYSISGTSQLLSTPYALHAKTAESVTGTIAETDPVFGSSVASGITGTDTSYWNNKLDSYTETDPTFTNSEAANITATDITNLSNLSGINSGDQDLSPLATKVELGDSISQIRSEIPTVPSNVSAFSNDAGYITTLNDNDPTNEIQQLSVSSSGDTLYLQNGGYVIIPGVSAANTIPTVTGAGGAVWMDRNLGATQVATSKSDVDSYGYFYQWGRGTDGHQERNLIFPQDFTSTTSTSPNPGHDDFITFDGTTSSTNDWIDPQNDSLWQGVNGINNPCPNGFRLPTAAEWETEYQSWTSQDTDGAFDSPLKLPSAGRRNGNSAASGPVVFGEGTYGFYWTSSVSDNVNSPEEAKRLILLDNSSFGIGTNNRAGGGSVRCIQD